MDLSMLSRNNPPPEWCYTGAVLDLLRQADRRRRRQGG
jgi:hypothetical protein